MTETALEVVKRRSVKEIIDAAGGPNAVAAAVSDVATEAKDRITADAVYKWSKIGIQDRYWPILMARTDATEAELHAANRAAREGRAA